MLPLLMLELHDSNLALQVQRREVSGEENRGFELTHSQRVCDVVSRPLPQPYPPAPLPPPRPALPSSQNQPCFN